MRISAPTPNKRRTQLYFASFRVRWFATGTRFQSSSLVDRTLRSAPVLAPAPDSRSSPTPLSSPLSSHHTLPIFATAQPPTTGRRTLCQRARPLLRCLYSSHLRRLAVIAFLHSDHPTPSSTGTLSLLPTNRHGRSTQLCRFFSGRPFYPSHTIRLHHTQRGCRSTTCWRYTASTLPSRRLRLPK